MTSLARKNIAGAILAGGLSRRMGGGDKSLLPLGGRPMIQHIIARLSPQVAEVAINANGDLMRFSGFGKPVFADVITGHAGPLAGVLSSMKWAADAGYSHVVTAAADTPFFPADLVQRFIGNAGDGATIVMATSNGNRHPVFALWPVAMADDLETWLKDTDTLKVMAWVRRHDLAFCDFPISPDGSDPFFNANTPEEFAEAETILQKAAA
jgi:molybdenum cofactor guanylyltransferase